MPDSKVTKNDDINQANVLKKNVNFKQLVMNNIIILPKGMGGGERGQWNKKHCDNQCGQNSLSKA